MTRPARGWRRGFAVWVVLCALTAAGLLATRPWVRVGLRFSNALALEELGGVGYVCFDIADVVRGRWWNAQLGSRDPAPYRDFLRQLAAARAPASAAAGAPPRRKHVVFVQMESVDGLVLRARHEGRPLMPFLEKLAREQVWFVNTLDNTAGGRTTDAELLVLTSLVPLRRAPAYVSQPLDRVPSLPRVLHAAGYDTWSMHGYTGSFWRRAAAHRALGFERSFFRDELDASDLLGWGVSDASVLLQAARRLAAAERPTFAHVILLTSHFPCTYVRERRGLPAKGFVDDYVHSVRYVDESIAGFFAALKTAGILDDCIVAVFGDHDSSCEPLLRRRLAQVRAQPLEDSVPLVIHGLSAAPRRIEEVAGLQDLPVTVLEELGLPVPPTFTGNSLGRNGRTVSALHGEVCSADGRFTRGMGPVDSEVLTTLALRYPERLSP